MNRAWIPAGALAGVSVAGLIALGPLTDSLGSQVEFPTSVKTAQSAGSVSKPASGVVPVSILLNKPVGNVETAALTRGGKAQTSSSATNSTDGKVAVKVTPGTAVTHHISSASRSSATPTHKTAAPPAATPKKAAKRQSIGGTSESNSDTGLASKGEKRTTGDLDTTLAP
jgi:hypothetical protein